MKSTRLKAIAAIVLAGTAVPALAQNAASSTADPYGTSTPVQDDDDDFPWGLLGLLGLAGLLGRKRDRDDVRRTGTGTDNNRM